MSLVEEAIEQLSQFQLPCSGKSAVTYLQSLLDQNQTAGLFRYFFAADYAAFKAKHSAASEAESLSVMEIELFNLVNDRLFPLDDIYDYADMEDDSYIDYVRDFIPIRTFGWCDWRGDGEIDQHPFEAQVLMYLADETIEEWFDEYIDQSAKQFVSEQVPIVGLENIDMQKLEDLCQRENSALTELPCALIHANGCSNNIFLDCYDPALIYQEDQRWSISTVKFWAEEWAAAKPILDRIDRLMNYLSVSKTHFDRVFELWNLCTKT